MKIKTWIKYEESYLPPRCRKLRYRECEDYVNIELKEVDSNELQLAFEDNSYNGKGKIYLYKGKLYAKTKFRKDSWYKEIEDREGIKINTALDSLIWCNENCSWYFYSRYDKDIFGQGTSREAMIEKAKNDMKSRILVNGELYEICGEPQYTITTFGLGGNHGGTGMFCSYGNGEFNALQGAEAVAYANKVASGRGDTEDVGRFEAFIVCHMPELVKPIKKGKKHEK